MHLQTALLQHKHTSFLHKLVVWRSVKFLYPSVCLLHACVMCCCLVLCIQEDEAARAYDKMMLWCEIHAAGGVKSGVTNFDIAEYEKEITWLNNITQVRKQEPCCRHLAAVFRTVGAGGVSSTVCTLPIVLSCLL